MNVLIVDIELIKELVSENSLGVTPEEVESYLEAIENTGEIEQLVVDAFLDTLAPDADDEDPE